jgi:ribosomal protein L32
MDILGKAVYASYPSNKQANKLKWKKYQNAATEWHLAISDDNQYKVLRKKPGRKWATLINGVAINQPLANNSHTAKSYVDSNFKPKIDGRYGAGGSKPNSLRKPRRTKAAISIGKNVVCSKCGHESIDGAVCSFKTTDKEQYPDKDFSFCMNCLSSFVNWFYNKG